MEAKGGQAKTLRTARRGEPRLLSRLFEEDADLLRAVPAKDASHLAREVVVRVASIPPGPWRPAPELRDERLLGLLVLDGLLIREEEVMGKRALELLGKGDLLRPGQGSDLETLPHNARWRVLEPARVAVLDRHFQEAIAARPEITVELVRRTIARSRRTVVALALARQPRLVPRVHALLWQLAYRFGCARDGIMEVPLRLSHAMLAELAGAERAAVTRAVETLEDRGVVAHRRGAEWLLLEEHPDASTPFS